MKEVRVKLENYEYEFSNLGKFYSIRYKKELKPNSRGMVIVHDHGKRKDFVLNRLIAERFVPNPDNCKYVRHKDGNKSNNRADNLYWSDYKNNKRVVLTSESGFQMVFPTMKKVAEHFGVSQQTLSTCVTYSKGYYKKFKVEKFNE